MLESHSLLQNMSAPPRSQVVIAPHRKERGYTESVSFFLPAIQKNTWEKDLCDITGLNSLQEIQAQSDHYFLELQPPYAFPIIKRKAGRAVHPLLSISILSRTIGSLFLARRVPELSYTRLNCRVTILDPDFIQKILLIEQTLGGE